MRKIDKGALDNRWIVWIVVVVTFVDHTAVSGQLSASARQVRPLQPPAKGPINVAIVISDGANVMDIAGPWEVFSDTMLNSKGKPWHESDGNDMVMPFVVYIYSV